MNKNELSTTELNLMLLVANENTNYAYEHIVKYGHDIFWCDLESQEVYPQDIASKVAFGSYNPYHEYVGYDAYGNIESMTEAEYRQELLDYYEEYSQELE